MNSRSIFRTWENIFKGAANHRRLEILVLMSKKEDLSTAEIIDEIGTNYHTGARHVRRLVRSGLLYTKRQGSAVLHNLSPRGRSILLFAQKCK